jgi:hypothetical protein
VAPAKDHTSPSNWLLLGASQNPIVAAGGHPRRSNSTAAWSGGGARRPRSRGPRRRACGSDRRGLECGHGTRWDPRPGERPSRRREGGRRGPQSGGGRGRAASRGGGGPVASAEPASRACACTATCPARRETCAARPPSSSAAARRVYHSLLLDGESKFGVKGGWVTPSQVDYGIPSLSGLTSETHPRHPVRSAASRMAEEVRRKRVLVVGGSGYLGQHLLASACHDLDVAFTYNRESPPQPLLDALPSLRAFRVDLRSGHGLEAISASFGEVHPRRRISPPLPFHRTLSDGV